ncbi:hypothetical protein DFJ74DRAFT_710437 [Hyaloraphidium curvatum]|nr:hypothetical protein DFJ74DRAFT_710437 [Hyaloraphidium curvatum]
MLFVMVIYAIVADFVVFPAVNTQIDALTLLYAEARYALRAMLAESAALPRIPARLAAEDELRAHAALLATFSDAGGLRATFVGVPITWGLAKTLGVTLITLGVALWSPDSAWAEAGEGGMEEAVDKSVDFVPGHSSWWKLGATKAASERTPQGAEPTTGDLLEQYGHFGKHNEVEGAGKENAVCARTDPLTNLPTPANPLVASPTTDNPSSSPIPSRPRTPPRLPHAPRPLRSPILGPLKKTIAKLHRRGPAFRRNDARWKRWVRMRARDGARREREEEERERRAGMGR